MDSLLDSFVEPDMVLPTDAVGAGDLAQADPGLGPMPIVEVAQLSTLDDPALQSLIESYGEPIGVITEMTGEVIALQTDDSERSLSIGSPIFQDDEIETFEAAGVTITFADETTFSLGPDSALLVDEYVYDPSTNDGQHKFSALKGVFVFVSGLVADDAPENITIDTPAGTLGIRGTVVAIDVSVDENGDPSSITMTFVQGTGFHTDNSGIITDLVGQFATVSVNEDGTETYTLDASQMQAFANAIGPAGVQLLQTAAPDVDWATILPADAGNDGEGNNQNDNDNNNNDQNGENNDAQNGGGGSNLLFQNNGTGNDNNGGGNNNQRNNEDNGQPSGGNQNGQGGTTTGGGDDDGDDDDQQQLNQQGGTGDGDDNDTTTGGNDDDDDNDTITGDDDDDTINGGDDDDTIDGIGGGGGGGRGGAEGGTLEIPERRDLADEGIGSFGSDHMDLSGAIYGALAMFGDDTIMSGDNGRVDYGGDGADVIYGSSGGDTFAGSGAELDSDIYYDFDFAADRILINNFTSADVGTFVVAEFSGDYDITFDADGVSYTLTLANQSPGETLQVTQDGSAVATKVDFDTASYDDGTVGDDTIPGSAGNDTILAGSGNDHLLGGGSADYLFDGFGLDTIEGGDGADKAFLTEDFSEDTIKGSMSELDNDTLFGFDFEIDLIDVTDATPGTSVMSIVDNGSSWDLLVDGDDNGTINTTLTFDGPTPLDSGFSVRALTARRLLNSPMMVVPSVMVAPSHLMPVTARFWAAAAMRYLRIHGPISMGSPSTILTRLMMRLWSSPRR